MKTFDTLAILLLVVGGLNWGLTGFFRFDLVAAIFGGSSALLARVVYAIVGLAAIYGIFTWKTLQKRWCVAAARS
ncbi:MAG: DUF378 domain-containing protein [Candidatus Eisenbacteria bacterium]